VRAVIFDCDGVLVDSEPLSDASWAGALADHGYVMTEEDVVAVRGTSEADCYRYFAARTALPEQSVMQAAVDARRLAGYPDLQPFADAAAAVPELALHGVPLAVASSSRGEHLRHKLRVVGLGRYFEVAVGGDEVPAGKPAPDVYLAAAAGLGIDPHDCLAVEDSVNGADAAVAAGMRVVCVARYGTTVGTYPTVDTLDASLIRTWLGHG
jgi:beta-phosphoglucomutase-like phosphatase (HAD superfamily)